MLMLVQEGPATEEHHREGRKRARRERRGLAVMMQRAERWLGVQARRGVLFRVIRKRMVGLQRFCRLKESREQVGQRNMPTLRGKGKMTRTRRGRERVAAGMHEAKSLMQVMASLPPKQ
jgi:hypothetical protein